MAHPSPEMSASAAASWQWTVRGLPPPEEHVSRRWLSPFDAGVMTVPIEGNRRIR